MKKIVRLTESDMVRLVRKVIKENEEQEMVGDVFTAMENLPDEEKIHLGKLLKNLGTEGFMNAATIGIENFINKENSIEEGLSDKTKESLYFTSLMSQMTSEGLFFVAGPVAIFMENYGPLIVSALLFAASQGLKKLSGIETMSPFEKNKSKNK